MNGFEMILPFLKPIEHLILDDTISEVMRTGLEGYVRAGDRVAGSNSITSPSIRLRVACIYRTAQRSQSSIMSITTSGRTASVLRL
jgi:hypothetical protein